MSINEFDDLGHFYGVSTVAFERARMLDGASAQMVKFGPIDCGTGTLPDGYRMWQLAVSWASPGASSFTALPQVDAPEFDSELCSFSCNCIPEPSPGEKLDALSKLTMYRLQYRNFGGYQTLLVNHTVDVNGASRAGIRWAELRRAAALGASKNRWGDYSAMSVDPGGRLHLLVHLGVPDRERPVRLEDPRRRLQPVRGGRRLHADPEPGNELRRRPRQRLRRAH
jgi:hypothetical protein